MFFNICATRTEEKQLAVNEKDEVIIFEVVHGRVILPSLSKNSFEIYLIFEDIMQL